MRHIPRLPIANDTDDQVVPALFAIRQEVDQGTPAEFAITGYI